MARRCDADGSDGEFWAGCGLQAPARPREHHRDRYTRFCRCYFGLSEEDSRRAARDVGTFSMIGICRTREAGVAGSFIAKQGRPWRRGPCRVDAVRPNRTFLKHSVLSVEGDAMFLTLLLYARAHRSHAERLGDDNRALWPNARCVVLHYGRGEETDSATGGLLGAAACGPYPRASLIIIVSTTRIEAAEHVLLCLDSYARCLDEERWCAMAVPGASERSPFRVEPLWPPGLPYFHGVGDRHCDADLPPSVGYPFTLTELRPCPEISAAEGPPQLGLYATGNIPYGTLFLYGGFAISTADLDRAVRAAKAPSAAEVIRGGSRSSSSSRSGGGGGSDRHRSPPQLLPSMDDTYALGLGKYALCFGQGLARYANHRYNLQECGNMDLCSVILPVPSGFREDVASPAKQQPQRPLAQRCAVRRRAEPRPPRDRVPVSTVAEPGGDEFLYVDSSEEMDGVVPEGYPDTAVTAPPPPSTGLADSGPRDLPQGPRRLVKATGTRKGRLAPQRRVYREEESRFATIPFFLVTTDVRRGEQLLAWTYGEDYDGKLERIAVTRWHLIPYADAHLLTRPRRRWDERGDSAAVAGESEVGYSAAAFVDSDDGEWQSRPGASVGHAPHPLSGRLEASMLRVVPTSTAGAEWRPAPYMLYTGDYRYSLETGSIVWRRRPTHATSPSLEETSVARPAEFLWNAPHRDLFQVAATAPDAIDFVLLRPLTPQSCDDDAPSGGSRGGAVGDDDAVDTMASTQVLLPLPPQGPPPLPECVVATVDSVGLLLAHIDYEVADQPRDAPQPAHPSRRRPRGRPSLQVNTAHLHAVTRFVRRRTTPADLPPLLSGIAWPLVQRCGAS